MSAPTGRPGTLEELRAALDAFGGLEPIVRARLAPDLIEACKTVLADERGRAMREARESGIGPTALGELLGISRDKVYGVLARAGRPQAAPAAEVAAAAVPVGPLARSAELIRPANPGLMHGDSALGMLWASLGDARQLEVGGHALGNVIADLGEGISRRRHDTNAALLQLRAIRALVPDGSAARLIDHAIARLDAPARPAPALPAEAPAPLHTLMRELNEVNLVRRGGDRGTGELWHETDVLAELTGKWLAGALNSRDFLRDLRGLRRRHESHEGYLEINTAIDRALADSKQWLRRPA